MLPKWEKHCRKRLALPLQLVQHLLRKTHCILRTSYGLAKVDNLGCSSLQTSTTLEGLPDTKALLYSNPLCRQTTPRYDKIFICLQAVKLQQA